MQTLTRRRALARSGGFDLAGVKVMGIDTAPPVPSSPRNLFRLSALGPGNRNVHERRETPYLRGSGSPSLNHMQPLGSIFLSAFLTIWICMTVSVGRNVRC